MDYFRPLPQNGVTRPPEALPLAGGWLWFDRVEVLRRDAPPEIRPATALPPEIRDRLTAPRAPVAGVAMTAPSLMGIVNVTPDSFSDGGRYAQADAAIAHGRALAAAGAAILDVGGESTRPGAVTVPGPEETARIRPVIEGLAPVAPVSVDTRKATVARAALAAGAQIVNDVSAFTHDPALAGVTADAGVPVCLMHTQGDPQTMQDDPRYDDVLLDVYDWLAERVAVAEAAGIPRARILVDPGIGFGKTEAHNLTLLRRLSLFHGLGCPLLLGVSRKRFIGRIGGPIHGSDRPEARMPGSVAVALAGVAQGAQVLRVHDVAETAQALKLWQAVTMVGTTSGTMEGEIA
ncbi:dihydropteroate synthase [Halodurantibacterium flavum]|uniref:Dihydropteroate synthase n=1 Tax=Halodurantibacterium flavum TaxID=1382802 RepID=A0ABW4S5G8_9RHOB